MHERNALSHPPFSCVLFLEVLSFVVLAHSNNGLRLPWSSVKGCAPVVPRERRSIISPVHTQWSLPEKTCTRFERRKLVVCYTIIEPHPTFDVGGGSHGWTLRAWRVNLGRLPLRRADAYCVKRLEGLKMEFSSP